MLWFLSTIFGNPEISFLAKISEERIDLKKILKSSQNMKGEIVRSIECNSTKDIVAVANSVEDSKIWHCRLGHMSEKGMKIMTGS